MQKILCASGNENKFSLGKEVLARYGFELEQRVIDIDEIQGEDVSAVIEHKARSAFAALGQPVIVTDDCWNIPALGGFPGPYMKSINHWFSAEDFLSLTRSLADKTIILEQLVACADEHEVVVFRKDIPGKLQSQLRGNSGPASQKLVALDIDEGLTIAEVFDKGVDSEPQRLAHRGAAWEELAKWLKEKSS